MISSKLHVAGRKKDLEAYYNALKPDEEDRERASYKIKLGRRVLKNDYELIVEIKAQDFTAFRAVATSVLNVMAIVDKTIKAAK